MPTVYAADFRETLARPADVFILAGCMDPKLRRVSSPTIRDRNVTETFEGIGPKSQLWRMALTWRKRPGWKLLRAECQFKRDDRWLSDSKYEILSHAAVDGKMIPSDVLIRRVAAGNSYVPVERYRYVGIKSWTPPKMSDLIKQGSFVTDYRIGFDRPASYRWEGFLPSRAQLAPVNRLENAVSYIAEAHVLSVIAGISMAAIGFRRRRKIKAS